MSQSKAFIITFPEAARSHSMVPEIITSRDSLTAGCVPHHRNKMELKQAITTQRLQTNILIFVIASYI